MADISKTVAIIFQGQDQTGAALGSLERGLGGVGAEADGAKSKLNGLSDGVDDLGRRGGNVDTLVSAFRALAAAVVVKEFIDANVEAEKFDRSMTLLKGSSEAAAEEFEYIKQVSNLLGTELFTTADAYVQLTAATRGTALEGQATRDIFEAVSVAMSSLGKSSADTQGALLAISQMASKGTVSMEELRGQLGERLPGAFQVAAKAMGMTTQELDALVSSGNLTADEFLPKLAAALKETYGDTAYIDTYMAAWNRLQNSMNEAFIELGDAGAFDVMTKAVEIGTASIVGAIAAFQLLGEIAGAVAGAIATGDFSGLGRAVDEAMTRAAEKTKGVNAALFEAKQEAVNLKYEGEAAGNKTAEGMDKAKLSAEDLAKASKEVDAALKALGIDPKQFKDPLQEVLNAFTTLANNPAVTGEQFLSGLLVTLDKLKTTDDFSQIVKGIATAYQNGTISAEQYTVAIQSLNVKQSGLWDGMIRTTKATDEQAKSTEKAKDEAKKYALELEKLASNERIKLIEARVELNVAQIQADTERIKSAFESLNVTVDSTAEMLGKLFDLFGKDLSFSEQWQVEDQIELENERRQEALDLQKELTQAQIEEMRARTQAMNNGDALIKIDGAGLQPHLEGFMWEILRTIQTRVNQDGMELLLGA